MTYSIWFEYNIFNCVNIYKWFKHKFFKLSMFLPYITIYNSHPKHDLDLRLPTYHILIKKFLQSVIIIIIKEFEEDMKLDLSIQYEALRY